LDETSIWDKLEHASQPLVILFITADPKDAEHLSDSKEAAVRLDLLGELVALQETVNAAAADLLRRRGLQNDAEGDHEEVMTVQGMVLACQARMELTIRRRNSRR
jgi:hypothetical protein